MSKGPEIVPNGEFRKSLRVGIAQMQSKLADVAANLEKMTEFVERAAAEEAELLVFPELALTGYPVGSWFSNASIRASSPEFARLKELSHRVPLMVGVIEETEDHEFFNSALYLSHGEVQHLHRKIYLPTYRQFDERRYFMAGWSVSAFDTPWGRMAMLICGDCWHLSLPYLAAHDGADVLVILAASSDEGLTRDISSREAWERMNRSYALSLANFVVFANMAGRNEHASFWGGSHVVRPDGGLLAQALFEREDLLVTTLDLNQLRQQRLILPFRRDDSLALTTELGREILRRKRQRSTGLFNSRTVSPPPSASMAEPPFPPVGVSDLGFGEAVHPEGNQYSSEDYDED